MITIKNKVSIEKMATAGQLLSQIFDEVAGSIKPGISTLTIDTLIATKLKEKDLVSMMKGYGTYKHVSCISINDEVVHGVPDEQKIVKTGDLLKIDVCASWKGYGADMARCYFVGSVPSDTKKFVAVAQEALKKGIAQAKAGNRLTDISAAIQEAVESHGYGVVRTFAGHGIGKRMHEDPEILNYGKPGKGPVLRPGMTFAIEPMITEGHHDVYVDRDGWTVRTKDKSLAAHVEDTVLVTEAEPRVLTRHQ